MAFCTLLLPILVLLARSAVCAFIPRPESDLSLFSRDASREEYRRFWNDDLEACILKYCLRHQTHGYDYMRCISKHCPAGLVTVPRDVEDDDVPEALDTPSNLQRMCAYISCGHTTNPQDLYECVQTKCDTSRFGSSSSSVESSPPALDPDALLRLDICALTECKGRNGAAYLDCMEKRCSPRLEDTKKDAERKEGKRDEDLLSQEFPLVRKRRVNPAMALCIDKHSTKCSGERLERAVCLKNYCNMS